MRQKITKLTAAQEAQLVNFRATWLAHGMSCEPADRPTAEAAVTELYRIIGKDAPRFLWFSSPAAAVMAIGMLKSANSLAGQIAGQIGRPLRAQLRGQLAGQLRGQLADQIRVQLADQLRGQLAGQLRQLRGHLADRLGDQIQDQVWSQLCEQLAGQLGDQILDQLQGYLGEPVVRAAYDALGGEWWGHQEAYWIAHYLFAAEIGVTYPDEAMRHLNLWADLARSTGWVWPYDGLVIMSDRPEMIHMDGEGRNARLHSTTGPALRYRDGYAVYAVHGTRVPEAIIEHPEAITVEAVMAERNAEVRRVMIDQMGERFLAEANPTILHEDVDGGGQHRRLLRIDIEDDEPIVACEVQCPSTGHKHLLRVPPTITRCDEAIAWTWDLPVSEYQTLVEA